MKKTMKIGIITLTIFMLSLTANAVAAPPPSLMDQIKAELELVQDIILEKITALSTQLSIAESTLTDQHNTIEDDTESIIGKVESIKLDTSQTLTEIKKVKEGIASLGTNIETLTTNIEALQSSVDSVETAVGALSTQMSTDHAEFLSAINGLSSNTITEDSGVFYTSETNKEVTITKTFSEPTRVSLWIYGRDGDEYWEGNIGSGGYDSFSWTVKVNGHKYMASSGRDYIDLLSPYKHPAMHVGMVDTGGDSPPFAAYSKTAWLLVDDIPILGEISVTIKQTLDRPDSDGSPYNDPIVHQWLIG